MSGSRIVRLTVASTSALLLTATAIGGLSAQQSTSAEAPPGPGLELIQRSCISCHDLHIIIQKRRTPAEWADTLGLMADRGAEVTPDEMKVIEDYLAHNFALRSTP
jgi:hypothetical protein